MEHVFSKEQTCESLTLKILGSGCCVPSLSRSSPANLIKFNGKTYLLDIGPGTLKQLNKAKEDYKKIDAIILSHRHPDHSADLIPLIQAFCYNPEFKREKDLLIIGAKLTQEFIESLLELYGFNVKEFKIIFKEPDEMLVIDSRTVFKFIKGSHSSSSIITKMEFACKNGIKKSIVYTGDTGYDEEISEFAEDCDLLITECSFPFKQKGHLSPEEAAELAQKAKARKLLLTHFYPQCDNYELQLKDRVKEYYFNKILFAQDFMEVII
ncbi:MAG: MBL fold metallo-hydrolase [bacterium]